MIVVEGPDGAGKTTLIRHLVEATGLEVSPRVVDKDTNAMVDLKKWTEDNCRQGFQATIFDRHRLISEPIYGPIMGRSTAPGFDDPNWFRTRLAEFYEADPVIIYCLPPIHTVWGNVKADDDNIAVRQSIHSIWGAYYNKAITDYIFYKRTYYYDYTVGQSEAMRDMLAAAVIARIEEEA